MLGNGIGKEFAEDRRCPISYMTFADLIYVVRFVHVLDNNCN